LGFEGRNENWTHLLRKSVPLAEAIEDLAPALAGEGPNPEYPWPPSEPTVAPAEHLFAIWWQIQDTAAGRQFLNLLDRLFDSAETFL
jgi:hypothetical protein